MVVPTWIENFRVVSNGNKSVKVYDSVINAPFGAVEVIGKTFNDVGDYSFVLLQMNFEIEKILIQIKLDGVDGHSGRMFKNKYIGLQAEFVYGKPDDLGNILDSDGNPIYGSTGPGYEIYYIPIAVIVFSNIGKDIEKKKIELFHSERLNLPFFANYYGLGYGD